MTLIRLRYVATYIIIVFALRLLHFITKIIFLFIYHLYYIIIVHYTCYWYTMYTHDNNLYQNGTPCSCWGFYPIVLGWNWWWDLTCLWNLSIIQFEISVLLILWYYNLTGYDLTFVFSRLELGFCNGVLAWLAESGLTGVGRPWTSSGPTCSAGAWDPRCFFCGMNWARARPINKSIIINLMISHYHNFLTIIIIIVLLLLWGVVLANSMAHLRHWYDHRGL